MSRSTIREVLHNEAMPEVKIFLATMLGVGIVILATAILAWIFKDDYWHTLNYVILFILIRVILELKL